MKKRRKTDVPHTTSEHPTEGEHQGENQHEYMNLSKEERESREKFKFANSDSDMNSGEVNKAAVDETTRFPCPCVSVCGPQSEYTYDPGRGWPADVPYV